MQDYFWIGLVGALLALLFALVQSRKVLKFSEGNETMQKIAAAIRSGANAYLKRQYKSVALFFLAMVIILAVLAWLGICSVCLYHRRCLFLPGRLCRHEDSNLR